jgi:DNA-binding CsgD family transcriptional regulator
VSTVEISEGQRKVFDLVVLGDSNLEIGRRLGISEKTVKAHVTKVLRAFGCASRSKLIAQYYIEAIAHAITQGADQSGAPGPSAPDQTSHDGSTQAASTRQLADTDRGAQAPTSSGVPQGAAGIVDQDRAAAGVATSAPPQGILRADGIGAVLDSAGNHSAAGRLT